MNPNNPTGRIMPADERAAVIEAASKANAWLLADEVYAGAETHTDEFTPTFYGDYDKVLAIGSMSKAYGLPGLRIGWVVGPREAVDRMVEWAYYITIVATHFGNKLAAVATSPEVRPRILERTRTYVRRGFDMVERWAAARGDVELTPPDASPVSVVKYDRRITSRELVERLAREKSVFVVPGDLFGLEGYVRINHGMPDGYVEEGLRRFGELLDEARLTKDATGASQTPSAPRFSAFLRNSVLRMCLRTRTILGVTSTSSSAAIHSSALSRVIARGTLRPVSISLVDCR